MSTLVATKKRIVLSDQSPKAYSYLRFSTPEQAAGDSQRRQTDLAQRYAERHGLRLDTELTFHDLGVSAYRGTNAEAGRLADFLEAVRAGAVEPHSWLLVESLDRLSRMVPRRAARVLEDIVDQGVTVVTLNDERVYTRETLDTDPTAFIVAILVFMRAHEESLTKSRRVRAAWSAKRTAAASSRVDRPYTRRAPAWLVWNDEAMDWVFRPGRAEVLREVFAWSASGVGQHAIAQRLNLRGEPTWGGSKAWHRSYVAKLLKNPAVVGTLVMHSREDVAGRRIRNQQGEAIADYYPAAVDLDTWDAVQARHGQRPRRSKRGAAQVTHVLAGLARCTCGATMTRVWKGRRGGKPKLVCTVAKRGLGCSYRSVPIDAVDGAIISSAGQLISDMPLADVATDQTVRDLDNALMGLSDLFDDLAQRPDGATKDALIRQLDRTRRELEAEREEAFRVLDERGEAIVDTRFVALLDTIATKPIDIPAVNAAMKRVFTSVTVEPTTGYLRLIWVHRPDHETVLMWGVPL